MIHDNDYNEVIQNNSLAENEMSRTLFMRRKDLFFDRLRGKKKVKKNTDKGAAMIILNC